LTIAQAALDRGIGARGLKSIVEQALMSTMYSLQELKRKGISKVRISSDVILNQKEPEYLKL
jgi:ATP-dependent Clp protease ATP-binding subunit ClpX